MKFAAPSSDVHKNSKNSDGLKPNCIIMDSNAGLVLENPAGFRTIPSREGS